MPNIEAAILANFERALCQIVKQCEKEENEKLFGPGGKPDKEWCHSTASTGKKNYLELGTAKTKCCERKVNERKAKSTTDFSKEVHAEKPISIPGGSHIQPDVVVGSSKPYDGVYDFKSSCPLTPKSKADWPIYDGKDRKPPHPDYLGKSQGEVYEEVCGKKPKIIHPNSETCKNAQ